MLKFRELTESEIDVRVAQVGDGWVQLLLYKDARVDMAILDETVGPENWTRDHFECKGNLFCRVGINVNYEKDGPERWVYKADCGAETYTEKEKGESSDSFKRACTNWGIGRELYTKIPIFVNVETKNNPNGKGYVMAKKNIFHVSYIEIDKDLNKIVEVEISDKYNKKMFSWKDENYESTTSETYNVVGKLANLASKIAQPKQEITPVIKPASEIIREPIEEITCKKEHIENSAGTTISGKTRVRRV
jgi:hypothetical protein